MSRQVALPISQLLPIQVYLSEEKICRYGAALRAGSEFPPIDVMPLSDDSLEPFLILNGHHTTRITFDAGDATIRSRIIETNAEVAEFSEGIVALRGFTTLKEMRDLYTEVILPFLKICGEVTIDSLMSRRPFRSKLAYGTFVLARNVPELLQFRPMRANTKFSLRQQDEV